MADDNAQVEKLKTIVREFVAELDTSTMPYINEGLRGTLTLTQMSDADRAAGKRGVPLGSPLGGAHSTVFNVSRAADLRWEGTDLKRSGEYLASAEKTIESFRIEGNYDLVNIRNLWKTALCGGDARGALDLIQKAILTFERYDAARQYEQFPYPPHDDLVDVLEALRTEQSCKSRLRDFSGNPEYVLPRPTLWLTCRMMVHREQLVQRRPQCRPGRRKAPAAATSQPPCTATTMHRRS